MQFWFSVTNGSIPVYEIDIDADYSPDTLQISPTVFESVP